MDAEGSPCPRCAVVGIVAGTVACMPRALDEEMARVIRLVCALLIVLVGLLAATQWVAAALGHARDLGAPWLMAGSTPVYPPWQLFVWWMAFGAQAPRVFDGGRLIAAGGGVVAALVALIGRGGRQGASLTIHGSARWPVCNDMASPRMRAVTGVLLTR